MTTKKKEDFQGFKIRFKLRWTASVVIALYICLCVCAVCVGLKHLNIRGEQVNLNIHSVDTNIDIGIRPILV